MIQYIEMVIYRVGVTPRGIYKRVHNKTACLQTLLVRIRFAIQGEARTHGRLCFRVLCHPFSAPAAVFGR